MAVVLGVDGARIAGLQGWVAVGLEAGKLASIVWHDTFAAVLEDARDAAVIAVDMPIGHDDPTGKLRGGRRLADVEAKAWLGPRAASLFLVPPLRLFQEADHASAVQRAMREGVLAPSAQAWGLRDRLREVNAAAAKDERVLEVHPECSFQALHQDLGGAGPLSSPKTTWNGLFERLDLLRQAGLRPSRSLGGVGRAGPDDVLDASIAAWTALGLAGAAPHRSFPAEPPKDPATGRAVAIWLA